jgi:hypothetical protein
VTVYHDQLIKFVLESEQVSHQECTGLSYNFAHTVAALHPAQTCFISPKNIMKLSPLSTPLLVLAATLTRGVKALPFPGFHVESHKLDEDSGNIGSFLVSNI